MLVGLHEIKQSLDLRLYQYLLFLLINNVYRYLYSNRARERILSSRISLGNTQGQWYFSSQSVYYRE